MKIDVLDHGYVKLIEPWGRGESGGVVVKVDEPTAEEKAKRMSPTVTVDVPNADFEAGIIEAARQSTQGAFRGWDEDAPLLGRLYRKRHSTPFEFAGMTIEVQAPIFVFREWHRHRTQSYSEMSARYAPLPDLYYQPDLSNVVSRARNAQTTKNRQEGAAVKIEGHIDPDEISLWLRKGNDIAELLEEYYQVGLVTGVPKEIARYQMPVGHYSRMRATGNLRNWFAFLELRTAPDAAEEIRRYANAVERVVSETFPRSYVLFAERRSREEELSTMKRCSGQGSQHAVIYHVGDCPLCRALIEAFQ